MLLVLVLVPCVLAQEQSANPASLTIPDGTPVKLRLVENVSSARAQVGDSLDFLVVKDVSIRGLTVIPAGTRAHGSITAVKGKRILGIGGNVALKLDSVELATGERAALRASIDVKGRSRTRLMAAAMIATGVIFLPAAPVFLLTRGHDSTVVKSTEITAEINGACSVPYSGLIPSRKDPSQLSEMMEYLPPRVFNGEGRAGDMVNLAFVARSEDLQSAFARAGWVKTDKWTPAFVWHLIRHGSSDARLPMARFYLFGRLQDYSYALPEPNAVMSRRHHLRIWKTDYTVGRTPIWVAAATHDIAIEIAKRGRLINHRIDPEVDAERDFVGSNLSATWSVTRLEYVQGVDPVLQAETSSGESYYSDGRILLLDLQPTTSAMFQTATEMSTMVQTISLPIAICRKPGTIFDRSGLHRN